jgi:hypothetical protein
MSDYKPSDDLMAMGNEINRLRSENAAQLAELHRISEAIGTNEGPSSVDHILLLRAEIERLRAEIAALIVQLDDTHARMNDLRADAERYRWLVQWLHRNGLLTDQFCQPGAFEKVADWWVLKEPAMIKGDSCVGYGDTPEKAINAAREEEQ